MSQDVASGGVKLEANTSREHLRAIIEQKLDQNTSQQAEASKGLRRVAPAHFGRHKLDRQGRSYYGSSRIRRKPLFEYRTLLS
jgi:hypothetical protein